MQEYINTDQQIHWLSQIIAKANRSFVPKESDDSHTNLYFDLLGNRIGGKWIETSGNKIILTLNLETLHFECLNASYKVVAFIETIGKTATIVEQEIADKLIELGLNPKGFTDKMHFEIPKYSFTNDAIQSIPDQNSNAWRCYRNLANQACSHLLNYLQIESEIRIWPHHFDTGIYAVTNNGLGIGFGLAMKDDLIGDAYFYMSAYPATGSLNYENLPTFSEGRWEVGENWQGAVLPLSVLKQLSMQEVEDAIKNFLLTAISWFIA